MPKEAAETNLFSGIAIAMLAWALLPFNPYGYYIVLRWVIALVGVYFATATWKAERLGWVVSFVLTSIVYNPIARVPLERSTWVVVNILTIALFVTYRRRAIHA